MRILTSILTLAVLLGAVTLLVAGCSHEEIKEATGVLIDVQSHEIQNADSITLRVDGGNQLTFQVSSEVAGNSDHPNSAAHLRQHMMLGDPVVVRYRTTADSLVAVRILDGTTI